jgi:hypothetical protein
VPAAAAVAGAGPHVHDRLAVEVDRQSPATQQWVREKCGEPAYRAGKVGIGGTLHPVGEVYTATAACGLNHIANLHSPEAVGSRSLRICD